MLSRKLVKLHTFELTDIPQVLRQNWENFVSHAPILVIFLLLWSGMICTQTYQFFSPHINYVVTLPQKIITCNMGIILIVTNLTQGKWETLYQI